MSAHGLWIATRSPRERQVPLPPSSSRKLLMHLSKRADEPFRRFPERLYSLGANALRDADRNTPLFRYGSDGTRSPHIADARAAWRPVAVFPTGIAISLSCFPKLPRSDTRQRWRCTRSSRCLDGWETQHRIDEFPLGEQDTPRTSY